MGVEAQFQAIPEDCELLKRARYDLYIADQIQTFNQVARGKAFPLYGPRTEPDAYFIAAVQTLITEHPGLFDRYFYAGGRTFDMITYLLSPERRQLDPDGVKNAMIYQVFNGAELLHPEAKATQGWPIGFVSATAVQTFTTYLNSISFDHLHEHYNPPAMWEAGVYKIHPTDDEEYFQWIWEEFQGMTRVYQAASDHNEAMITVID